MGRMRLGVTILGALLAAATAVTAAGCKHGDYDGSFDGSLDGGGAIDGSTTTRTVQPDKMEIVSSSDGVFDITFAAGTFAQPATITITSAGEQTLIETGLIVPIYSVSADKEPAKFFQVTFHGIGDVNGGSQTDRGLVPALSTAGSFTPLAVAGVTPNQTGPTRPYWGLTKTFGTYSLAVITGTQSGAFVDNVASCTAQCSHANGPQIQVAGHSGGCFCSFGPDLACFLQHCGDIAAAGARCSAIASSNQSGPVSCAPFGSNCPGSGCTGSFPGQCGTGGGPGGGGTTLACCIQNKTTGTCSTATCTGFSPRCTANSCPANTKCCVFETESYCTADCPEAQVACASAMDCADAGPDGGTCQGGSCPVGVCGTPPSVCK